VSSLRDVDPAAFWWLSHIRGDGGDVTLVPAVIVSEGRVTCRGARIMEVIDAIEDALCPCPDAAVAVVEAAIGGDDPVPPCLAERVAVAAQEAAGEVAQ
jgi:hypothetical protein